jgi:hypothetical protein
MFAGNDISPVQPIVESVKSELLNSAMTRKNVIDAFKRAFQAEIVGIAETAVLSRFGMSMIDFRREGLANFGRELFTQLAFEIKNVELDLIFLIFGYENKVPHIFTVQSHGEASHYDVPGFWAIGSGQMAALGALFNTQVPLVYQSLTNVLALMCQAKFVAESAPGVGGGDKWRNSALQRR